jgi:hypothetical protein
LNYLKDNDINVAKDFEKDKSAYLTVIDHYFPEANLMKQLVVLREEDTINKIVAQKFNGDLVMSWLPNLQGKELGAAITGFKLFWGDNYRNFILNSSFDQIHDSFMRIYNGANQQK